MQCPVCTGVSLVMSERNGIEIDYCPKCRGVWLDRGELDKIIERAASVAPQAAGYRQSAEPSSRGQPYQQPQYHGDSYHQDGNYYKKKKREGFLGELFDFD